MDCRGFTARYTYRIPDMEFIQGDTVVIPFQFTDRDGEVIIPQETDEVQWVLSSYDFPAEKVFQFTNKSISQSGWKKSIEVDDEGTVYILLNSEDTSKCVDHKYVQQPILKYNGTPFIRAFGDVVFLKRVGG